MFLAGGHPETSPLTRHSLAFAQNDRLITLRNLVPACLQEIEDRVRGKIEEQEAEEAARAAAAAGPASGSGATSPAGGQRAKRKRNRKKAADTTKGATTGADPELGLHKLEVLTHTIGELERQTAGGQVSVLTVVAPSRRLHLPASIAHRGARDGRGTHAGPQGSRQGRRGRRDARRRWR